MSTVTGDVTNSGLVFMQQEVALTPSRREGFTRAPFFPWSGLPSALYHHPVILALNITSLERSPLTTNVKHPFSFVLEFPVLLLQSFH